MTTNFNFTRKDFYKAISDDADMQTALAELLTDDKHDVNPADVNAFCKHALEMLNKERKVSEKKLAEQAEINQRVLDAIPFDEPIGLAELAEAVNFSKQRTVAAITRLINSGVKIEKSIIDKKAAYKRREA